MFYKNRTNILESANVYVIFRETGDRIVTDSQTKELSIYLLYQ